MYEMGAELPMIGMGRFDSLRLLEEADAYLQKRNCRAVLARTSKPTWLWN
jgi:hypothetical protein